MLDLVQGEQQGADVVTACASWSSSLREITPTQSNPITLAAAPS